VPRSITETTADEVRDAMSVVYPAVEIVGRVLPGMLERGAGGLLFAGGLSAVRPLPPLGALAVSSAALRNYAVTLNAGLAGTGVHAGTLTIGGLIERGDIHQMATSQPGLFGDVAPKTLDPDELAESAWELYEKRDRAEAIFSVLG
jgi:short-subunit dehydrogenase